MDRKRVLLNQLNRARRDILNELFNAKNELDGQVYQTNKGPKKSWFNGTTITAIGAAIGIVLGCIVVKRKFDSAEQEVYERRNRGIDASIFTETLAVIGEGSKADGGGGMTGGLIKLAGTGVGCVAGCTTAGYLLGSYKDSVENKVYTLMLMNDEDIADIPIEVVITEFSKYMNILLPDIRSNIANSNKSQLESYIVKVCRKPNLFI